MIEKINGFTNYGVDAVVKFGGSLLSDTASTSVAIDSLASCARIGHRILVIPGGGPTDNTIEKLNETHGFMPDTHHAACARAQDQTGLLISDDCFGDTLKSCESLAHALEILDRNGVAVLLPSRFILDINPFEKTWEITSDAMAAWFAWLIHCRELVILTDVDGIYDPRKGASSEILRSVNASILKTWGKTAVDSCTPSFLLQAGINCYVINGSKPNRLVDLLEKVDVISTQILPR